MATSGLLLFIVVSGFAPNALQVHQDKADECIASLSGFPKDASTSPKLPYPADTTGLTLEYTSYGCYGGCAEFTLTIREGTAVFEGRAHARAKGKRTAKLSSQQFDAFLHAWYDGNFYAMRDDYCDIRCPDGTQIVVTDVFESSITLTTPSFKKQVYQCFSEANHKPETPKPPEQFFQLSQALRAFASSHHWI